MRRKRNNKRRETDAQLIREWSLCRISSICRWITPLVHMEAFLMIISPCKAMTIRQLIIKFFLLLSSGPSCRAFRRIKKELGRLFHESNAGISPHKQLGRKIHKKGLGRGGRSRKINSNYLLSTFSRSQVGVCERARDTTQEAPKKKQANRTYWTAGQGKVCGTNKIFIERRSTISVFPWKCFFIFLALADIKQTEPEFMFSCKHSHAFSAAFKLN